MTKPTLTALVIFTLCGLAYAGPEAFSGKDMKQVVPVPEPCYDWTGFYIGAHAGYGFANDDTHFEPLPTAASFFNLAPTTLDPDGDGFIGGIQFGYNHQFGRFVVGVENSVAWADIDGSRTVRPIIQNNGTPFPGTNPYLEAREATQWFGTLRGKIGFTPFCRLLLYATGGLAFGEVYYAAETEFRTPGTVHYPASFYDTRLGWVGGGGAEIAINRRWSIKAEFLYHDLGDKSFTANPSPVPLPFQVRYDWETAAYTFDAGVNFHF